MTFSLFPSLRSLTLIYSQVNKKRLTSSKKINNQPLQSINSLQMQQTAGKICLVYACVFLSHFISMCSCYSKRKVCLFMWLHLLGINNNLQVVVPCYCCCSIFLISNLFVGWSVKIAWNDISSNWIESDVFDYYDIYGHSLHFIMCNNHTIL